MNFIIEHYVAILTTIMIVLMAFIGYLAEKTDFGRNKIEKSKKIKQKPTKNEKIKIKNQGINDISNGINNVEPEKNTKELATEQIDEIKEENLSVEQETIKEEIKEEVAEEEDIWKF